MHQSIDLYSMNQALCIVYRQVTTLQTQFLFLQYSTLDHVQH